MAVKIYAKLQACGFKKSGKLPQRMKEILHVKILEISCCVSVTPGTTSGEASRWVSLAAS